VLNFVKRKIIFHYITKQKENPVAPRKRIKALPHASTYLLALTRRPSRVFRITKSKFRK
jgi:hypothetical protein